jgi:hypothetical protein
VSAYFSVVNNARAYIESSQIRRNVKQYGGDPSRWTMGCLQLHRAQSLLAAREPLYACNSDPDHRITPTNSITLHFIDPLAFNFQLSTFNFEL